MTVSGCASKNFSKLLSEACPPVLDVENLAVTDASENTSSSDAHEDPAISATPENSPVLDALEDPIASDGCEMLALAASDDPAVAPYPIHMNIQIMYMDDPDTTALSGSGKLHYHTA